MAPAEPLRSAVAALLQPDDDPDFGWIIHAPRADGHLLVSCEVSEFWRAMPSQAVRSAIAQRIRRWADALAPSLGVAAWGRDGQDEILVVAIDQAVADMEAKIVTAYCREALKSAEDRRQEWRERAEKAEPANARVRRLAEEWADLAQHGDACAVPIDRAIADCGRDVLAALDDTPETGRG